MVTSAHDVQGNEGVDILANQTIRKPIVKLHFFLSKKKVKSIINSHINTVWQECLEISDTVRHLYQFQKGYQ